MNDLAARIALLEASNARLEASAEALREDVQMLTRRMLANDDRRDLARLLPAAWATFGASSWTAADLATRAAGEARDPHLDALLQLLTEHVTDSGGLRAFGRFLARVEGVACAGLRLDHQDDNGGRGAVYVVRAMRGFRVSETAPIPGVKGDGPTRCQHDDPIAEHTE